jgi:hypothetical protein
LHFAIFFPHDTQWVAQGYHGKKENNSRLYKKRMPTGAELSIFEKPMMQDLTRKECFQEQNFPFMKSLARIYAVKALSRYTRRNQRRSL